MENEISRVDDIKILRRAVMKCLMDVYCVRNRDRRLEYLVKLKKKLGKKIERKKQSGGNMARSLMRM